MTAPVLKFYKEMRRLILVLLLLALVLAPLEMLGVLRKGYDQLKTMVGGAETQSLVSKFRIELPKLSSSISGFLSKIFPWLEVGIKEVQ